MTNIIFPTDTTNITPSLDDRVLLSDSSNWWNLWDASIGDILWLWWGGWWDVTSVNGQTGDVVLDIITSAERSKLAWIEAWAEVNNISDANAIDLTDWGTTSLHNHDNIYTPTSALWDLALLDTVNTAQIDNSAVTNQKLAHMNANTVKGKLSEDGVPQDIAMADLPVSNATQSALDGKLNKSGDTMTGKLTLPAWTTASAPLNIPNWAAPTIPLDWDIRTQTGSWHLFYRSLWVNRLMLDNVNMPAVTQAEAEAGTAVQARLRSPLRVRQAIASFMLGTITRSNNITMHSWTGSPEWVVTANPWSIFQSTDWNVYRKSTWVGSTWWVAVWAGWSTSQTLRITIPWDFTANTTGYQWLYFRNTSWVNWTISNVSVSVWVNASWGTPDCSVQLYKSSWTLADGVNTNAVALFSSNISLGTNYESLTNVPNVTTVENGRWLSMRIMTNTGTTRRAADLQLIITLS